ncbi:hypothetical protein ACVWZV_006801 [Bradyrhizobium sp. GM5.1]
MIMMLRHIFTADETPSLSPATLAAKTHPVQKRLQLPGPGTAEQQRHLDAIRRHRRHNRALDITSGGAINQRGSALLGGGRRRIEIQEPGALIDRGRAGLCHRHGLARGDRGDDEIGLGGQLGVRGCEPHTEFFSMLVQRTTLLARELDVKGCDLDVLLAQILGQNPADLAITDQPDLPSLGIARHQFSPRVVASNRSSTA